MAVVVTETLLNVLLWDALRHNTVMLVYVTSDNPRTEDPVQIVEDVEVGVKDGLREELTMKLSLIVGKRFNMQYNMQNLGILY